MSVRPLFTIACAFPIAATCRGERAIGSSASARVEPEDPLGAILLPAAGPFAGGPLERGPGFVRRAYARGPVRINVTIGRRPMSADEYDRWVRASADYPPSPFGRADGSAAGFYDCSGPPEREACSLHIQLRAGYHVEVMGGGTASRADLAALAGALPLAALIGGAPPKGSACGSPARRLRLVVARDLPGEALGGDGAVALLDPSF